MRNFYDVLEVSPSSPDDDIKKAYRRLAKERHPDKPGGSQELFTELNQAYQVLKDPKDREDYDLGKWDPKKPINQTLSEAETEIIGRVAEQVKGTMVPDLNLILWKVGKDSKQELERVEANIEKGDVMQTSLRKSIADVAGKGKRVYTLATMMVEQHIAIIEGELAAFRERKKVIEEICNLIELGEVPKPLEPESDGLVFNRHSWMNNINLRYNNS